MRIRVFCPNCGVAFTAAERHAGKVGRCPGPNCGRKLRVPDGRPKVVFESMPDSRSKPRRSAATSTSASSRFWEKLAAGSVAALALAIGVFVLLPEGGSAAPPVGISQRTAARPVSVDDVVDPPHPDSPAEPKLALASMIEPDAAFATGLGTFLEMHCTACHGPDLAEADLDLGAVASADDLRADRDKWERILAIIKVGAMPPAEMDQPTMEQRTAAVDWIDRVLHDVDCQVDTDPGRVTVRRLNRTEYDNTVRDLLGLDLTLSDDFPADDVGNGFDNQGDVLSLPPLLLEKYLAAAERIAEKAVVGDLSTLLTTRETFNGESSVDRIGRTFKFRGTGRYTIRVSAFANQAGPEKARFAVRVGDDRVAEMTVEAHQTPETFERTVQLDGGSHRVEVQFLNDYYRPDAPGGKQDRNLYVRAIEVTGPLGRRPENLPKTHRAIVVATPEEDGGVRHAAEAVFRPLVSRAYRRPATDLEVQRLASFVEAVVEDGRTYEQGVQLGLQAVLCSPHFLFRIERDPADAGPGESAQLTDYELASRLSYFLWSSMPDEELFRLAEQGRLSDDETLAAQVERMMDDPKSGSLIDGFFAQWLNLAMLDEFSPNARRVGPLWTNATKAAMRRETELLCGEIVRENLPVRTFLDADFTFVNPRLAEFYGLPWNGKSGDAMQEYYIGGLPDVIRKKPANLKRHRDRREFPFRDEEVFKRVPLPETRRGVLTHGSILSLTSNPVGTSPVKRGKWILDNVLGAPPPPAPPNVPALEETQEANKNLSLRDALAKHREDPGCASCHAVMDPLGFAFEHFDLVGRWREKDGRFEVDASGELPGGQTFEGATELVEILSGRSDEFVTHFTRQLMTYGLGRGLEWFDRCGVDGVVESARLDGHRFRDLVKGVVLSDPFRRRTAAALAAQYARDPGRLPSPVLFPRPSPSSQAPPCSP